jgi:WD40 repeat protein/serine/threonine protein kinase
MSDDASSADLLGQIADEFVEAFRRGRRPSVEEFARRYPEHADDIREMLPALVLMEEAKSADGTSGQRRQARASAAAAPLRQLGDYEILREIGRGGMGVVYEARQLSLGRHVAIKVLPSHALLDPRHLARFGREARAAARLHHTNIVPVFGVGEQDGLHYYVMQFIPGLGLDIVLDELRRLRLPRGKSAPTQAGSPGRPTHATQDVSAVAVARALLSGEFRAPEPAGALTTLAAEPAADAVLGAPAPARAADASAAIHLPGQTEASALSESGNQYWQSVARVGVQVADALAHAASQGVLHRDIKPSNLLLDDTGNVWVTDFGLAKADTDGDNLTHTGDIVGTLRYMAPERFSGRGDLRSDVYSLGLTLYELLALRPAFDEADRNKLVKQVLHDEPERPRRLNPAVPRDLETVVLKAIARDPAHRYQTPAEMAEDLKRFVEDRPVRARRVSETEKFLRWCRRNPLVASLLAGIVLVFLLGFAGVSWQWREAEAARGDEQTQRGQAEAALDRERAEHNRAEAALWESQHQLALNSIQRGVALVHAGKTEIGLAWLERGLRATAADDPIRDGARNLIAGWTWGSSLALPHEGPVMTVAFSKDGRTAVTGSSDKTARLWDAQTGAPRGAAMGHDGRVGAVAFSPNGDLVLTASWDKTARFWDARSGAPRGAPLRHQDRVAAVAFSPNGETAVTCSWDKTARLWDVRTGQAVGEPLHHDGPVVAVAFSPDGRLVLTGSYDRTARLWDARTGAPRGVTLRHFDVIRAVAYSPDGTTLLTASNDNTARLWDATTGKPQGAPLRHEDRVVAAAFSPDGKVVITGSFDHTARLWHAASGIQRGRTLRHEGPVVSVAFSPDDRTAVTGSFDTTARLWDATTGESRGQVLPHEGIVYAATFSPDGKTILVGCWANKARLWDAATGAPRGGPLPHEGGASVALFSPDGASVLTASNNTARLWDAATGRPRGLPLRHDDRVSGAAWGPDGKAVATVSWDRTLRLWNAGTGAPVGDPMRHQDRINAVVFSPDGKTLLTASHDKTAQLWEVSSGRARGQPMRHQDSVEAVAFGPDGKTALTGSHDRTARLWDAATGEPRTDPLPHEDVVRAVAFSPDGKTVLTGSRDRSARLWDAETGAPRCPPLLHEKAVNHVAFSPDGKLALTCSDDNTARLWDAATGAPRAAPMRHRDAVRMATFSPDGRTVMTAGKDDRAGLWDAVTGELRGMPLTHQATVLCVAFSPDGKTVLTASDDKTARLWDFPPAVPDEPERIRLWVEVQTGQTWDPNGVLRALSFRDWATRRQQLIEQGGAPIPWRRQETTAPD